MAGRPDHDLGETTTLAVVVTPGDSPYLARTLRALSEQERLPDELLIVDISSPSHGFGSGRPVMDIALETGLDDLTEVKVVTAPKAATFGAAVRAGLASRTSRYVRDGASRTNGDETSPEPRWLWLLHDDSAPEPRALAELVRAASVQRSVGIAGAKQCDWSRPDHLLQVGLRATVSARRVPDIEPGEIDQGQHDHRGDALAAGTAGMLLRRSVWDELGGTDPVLGPFGDGLDLCRRAWLAGHRVIVVPTAVVHHARASYLGLRDAGPEARAVPDERRSYGRRRRAQLHNWLVGVPLPLLPLVVLAILAIAPLRALWRVAAKDLDLVTAEMRAAAEAVASPRALFRSRRRARRTRRVSRRYVRSLYAQGRDIRRARRDLRRTRAAARLNRIAPSELELAERAVLARRRRSTASVLFGVLVVLALVAFAPLLAAGPLTGGALWPHDRGLAGLWQWATSWWIASGLGHAGPPDPFLWVLTVLGAPLQGSSALPTVLVVAALPVAGLGAWFAAGAATRSVLLRGWAALVWATAPVLLLATSSGRLGGIVTHLLLPWVVLGVAHAVGVRRVDVIDSGLVGARRAEGSGEIGPVAPARRTSGGDRVDVRIPAAGDDEAGSREPAEDGTVEASREPSHHDGWAWAHEEETGSGGDVAPGSLGDADDHDAGTVPGSTADEAVLGEEPRIPDPDPDLDSGSRDAGIDSPYDADPHDRFRPAARGGVHDGGPAPEESTGPAGDATAEGTVIDATAADDADDAEETGSEGEGQEPPRDAPREPSDDESSGDERPGDEKPADDEPADDEPGDGPSRPEHVALPAGGRAAQPAVSGTRPLSSSGSIAAAAASGLALAGAVAGTPALLPAVLVVLLVLAFVVPRRRRLLVLVALPAIVITGPLLTVALSDPAGGSWRVLLADPGVALSSDLPGAWSALLGWPDAAPVVGWLPEPWAGALPYVGGAVLLVTAVLALVRGTRRGRGVRVGWFLALAGLVTATACAAVPVALDVVDPGEVVTGWPGGGTSVTVLGLLMATVCAADGMYRRLSTTTFGWRQITAVLAAIALIVGQAAGLVSWLDGMRGDGETLALSGRQTSPVPALAEQLQEGPDRSRVLTFVPTEDSLSAQIWRGTGPQLTETSAVVSWRAIESVDVFTIDPRPADEAAAELATLVAELAGGTATDAGSRLADFAVAVLIVPPVADDALAPAARDELVASLDATPGLERVTENSSGIVWRVSVASGQPGGAVTTARAQVVSGDGSVIGALPSEQVDVRTQVPQGDAGRRVVLSERFDPGWRATYDGRPLRAVSDGWRQAFELPVHTGELRITYRGADQIPWRIVQIVVLGVVVLLAVPVRRRRDAEEVVS